MTCTYHPRERSGDRGLRRVMLDVGFVVSHCDKISNKKELKTGRIHLKAYQ